MSKVKSPTKKKFRLIWQTKYVKNYIYQLTTKLKHKLENKMKKMKDSINKDLEELKNEHTETTQLLKLKIL